MPQPNRTWAALGLMSGTSMDGIDACLATISLSQDFFEFEIIAAQTFAFNDETRSAIRDAQPGSANKIAALHYRLGARYADAATAVLNGHNLEVVGLHGQTVAHSDDGYTLQVGSPTHLSQRLQVPVVYNFREADVVAGGHGAPLVPYLDWLYARQNQTATLTLNLGGIANLCYVPAGSVRDKVIGFDTGPAMSLIDCACERLLSARADLDGELSRGGHVDERLLASLMAHPFVTAKPPKSTGIDEFGDQLVDDILNGYAGKPADLLRTLIRFTALSVVQNIHNFISADGAIGDLIVSGGGSHHPTLMADLAAELPDWQIKTSETIGVDPDYKEALLMAVLAVAKMEHLPANMPSVTGAGSEVILGQIADSR